MSSGLDAQSWVWSLSLSRLRYSSLIAEAGRFGATRESGTAISNARRAEGPPMAGK
jgi:hypothetical protein